MPRPPPLPRRPSGLPGWQDCGSDGANMQERAARLSGLSARENPDYASSITWEPQVGLDRARAYYRWRLAHNEPEGPGTEAAADAAARSAFYRFALEELEAARIEEVDGRVVSTVPLLPRNTDDVAGDLPLHRGGLALHGRGGGTHASLQRGLPGRCGRGGGRHFRSPRPRTERRGSAPPAGLELATWVVRRLLRPPSRTVLSTPASLHARAQRVHLLSRPGARA